MDHADSRRFHFEKLLDLARGKVRNRDDQVRPLGRAQRLIGEACAEFGRRIVSAHYEQIVEGRDRAPMFGRIDALVQAVKQVR